MVMACRCEIKARITIPIWCRNPLLRPIKTLIIEKVLFVPINQCYAQQIYDKGCVCLKQLQPLILITTISPILINLLCDFISIPFFEFCRQYTNLTNPLALIRCYANIWEALSLGDLKYYIQTHQNMTQQVILEEFTLLWIKQTSMNLPGYAIGSYDWTQHLFYL